jgi:hypothetical protein
LLENGQFGVTAAGFGEQSRQRGRAVGVARQHHRLAAATHGGVHPSGDEADDLGVLHGPADPGACQRHRRDVRQDSDPVRPEHLDQRVADPVQQRVATGDHVDVVCVALGVVEEGAKRGQQRRRPRPPDRRHGVVKQLQLPR